MIASSIVRTGVFALAAIFFNGCSLHQYSEEAPVKSVEGRGERHGYALLFSLMADEKNVSKLLVVKRERAELRELIKQISEATGRAHARLENFAKADRSLNLNAQGLPPAESATRAAIARTKGKALLTDGGKEFEVQLLLSQNEALTYGAHLAEMVGKGETNAQRARYLEQLAAELRQLQGKVVAMLLANYNWRKGN